MALDTLINTELGQSILIFILVFTVVFAVLQKSEILGKGKSQVDALVSLAIGLLVVTVGYATSLIKQLVPFLAVSLIVILVFLLLVGIFFKPGEFSLPKGVLIVLGIGAFIAVVIAVISFTNSWPAIQGFFAEAQSNQLIANVVLFAVVAAAIWFVLKFAGKSGG